MKPYILFLLSMVALPYSSNGQKELVLTHLDSAFAYADKNSSVSKTGAEQVLLARYQKLAAVVNIINLRSPVAFNLTNNTQLPVSFIPSSLLGGPPGTFKEITLGQEYVSNFSVTPQIDIINLGAWSRVRSADLNESLTLENNLLSKKSLFEAIAASWYNILSLREQIEITNKNLFANDTLLQIVTDKYTQGLVRHQDVNDATVSKITLLDKIQQLEYSLEQQVTNLKILCDIPSATQLTVADELSYAPSISATPQVNSQLLFKSAVLQSELARADLRTNRLLNMPVVSLLYSHSTYQNSNNRFFDTAPHVDWLNSTFFGAKITLNLPDVNQIVLARNSKINYETALINREHSKLQNEGNNSQLLLDYEKAVSQLNAAKQIWQLKEENYRQAKNQYSESVLPFDKLLLAFTDMESTRLNYSSAMANLLFLNSKIDIGNRIN
jgi:outer membrane protein TolC